MDRDPTPGDPDEVRDLADDLQEFADDVGEALGKIRGLASERAVLDWAGLSADAFRSEFEGVPDNLTKLEDSYSLCSQALHTYWPKLQTAQGMADRALDRAISAQADLASAQAALGDAQDWVGRAGDEAERLQREGERENVEPPDEADVRAAARDQQAAEAAAGAARSRVDDAEERLAAARQLALDAQEMREEAARVCAQGIEEASDAGIQNRRWWEKAIKWVTDNWDTLVEVCKVIVAVLGIVVMIIGGPLAWVVLAAALVVLADTLIKYAKGEAGLLDVAFAALDCIPGMKGLTTLGGLARGLKGLASTGLRGLRQGALRLGRRTRGEGVPMNGRNACGDPVDVATGELLMSATDVELPGVLPLVVERHHISSYGSGRWFGSSWASTLDQRLVLDEHGARLFTADGMTLLYPRPIPGEPVFPVEGPRWSLSWDGQPLAPMSVYQPASGRTLHFAPVDGRAGSELPLIAITDRNDNRIQLAYDDAGAPTDIHHSGGYHLGITTDGGRVSALTLLSDPDEPTLLTYGYDTAGLLAEITNSSGLPLKFSYDERARMSRWEDRNGYWYSYAYDEQGRCVHTTGTDRALEYRYAYDEAAHRTVVTDSLGHDSVYQFNDSYQLIAHTDPLGHTTTHTWDRYDRTLTTTDPLGHTTRYTYDDQGRLVRVVCADGGEIGVTYNALGLAEEVRQQDGGTWRQSYDARGNRVALVDPAGNRTRYTYDERGRLASVEDAAGSVTRLSCDAAGLPLDSTDAAGQVTSYRRDGFGRLIEMTDPLGRVSRFDWSPDGYPLRQIDALGGTRTWEWDAEGNLVTQRSQDGATIRYEYGPFDLPVAQIRQDGARYELTRDTELRLTRVTGPHGLSWDYTFDPAGRLVAESDFDGRTVTYRLDATGRLVERVNAEGQTVSFERDALGRIVRKRTGEQVTTYAYDPVGRLTRAEGDGTPVVLERDALGRVLAETVGEGTVRQSYDPLGRPATRQTPSGHRSGLEYDLLGRPVRLATGAHTLTFDYDALGREIRREIDTGLTLERQWDALGRLTDQSVSQLGSRVAHRTYRYRESAHPVTMTDEAVGTTRFELDEVGRVTRVHAPGWTESYAYDGSGNQLAARWPQRPEQEADGERGYTGTRLVSAGRQSYRYDRAGRVVAVRRRRLSRKPDQWRYVWDAEDRLVEVVGPSGDRWTYAYDLLGRRIAKRRHGASGEVVEETRFVWSGSRMVERTHGRPGADSTTLTWDYHGLAPVAQTERRRERDETDRRFYAIVTDLVGAPSELVDEEGRVAWRAGQRNLWGAPAGTSPDGVGVPLRFPGQYEDEETGWYYNYHRHYDPETARYTSPDPLGLAPAPNHYAYVHNPLVSVDPLGLSAHVFDNKMANNLDNELRVADNLGVTPVRPGTQAFDDVIGGGQVKWAVLENGDLVVVPKFVQGTEIAHPVLSRGNPVQAAGEANIAGDMELGYFGLDISNHSGHFQPDADSLQVGLDAFSNAGIAFPEAGISFA
ncbi:DUF6531 domain-containing protein [Streptomyces triticirhizae]|nr:DUF6531 domain-containing protein [Streptomyces triticirhizae]